MKRYKNYDFTQIRPYQSKSYTLVETVAQLRQVATELKGVDIVGIDLENEHQDTYNGYTCLIQLSSYKVDEIRTYVIDVLKQEIAANLASVLGVSLFENPKVLKLLHGCLTSDLPWMARDFGIKLVSTFDT